MWFGLETERFFQIIRALIKHYPATDPLVRTCFEMLAAPGTGSFDKTEIIESLDAEDPRQMVFLTLFRMFEYRLHGYPVEALQQSEILREYLGTMHPFAVSRAGWKLHAPIQVGVCAMLAGDFSRALAAFTETQMHPTLPTFSFSTRDALIKSPRRAASWSVPTTLIYVIDRGGEPGRGSGLAPAISHLVPNPPGLFETSQLPQRDHRSRPAQNPATRSNLVVYPQRHPVSVFRTETTRH